jgi:RNA polymerase-interacting CarD/CdnL/TRCF family regulator
LPNSALSRPIHRPLSMGAWSSHASSSAWPGYYQSILQMLSGVVVSREQVYERQVEIRERLNQGALEAICSVVRDLTVPRSSQRLSENDSRMLKRTRKLLLDEWVLVMDVLKQEAESHLSGMLQEGVNLSSQHA